VVVAEDDQGGIPGWEASKGFGERDRAFWVVPIQLGGTLSPEHLAHAAETFPPPVGDRHVQRDAVEPRLRGGLGLPPTPRFVGADERLLGALLGGPWVAEDPGEREEDPVVAVPEQPVEILPDPRSVGWAVFLHPYQASARGPSSERAISRPPGSQLARTTVIACPPRHRHTGMESRILHDIMSAIT
jgi:hypothetical protein